MNFSISGETSNVGFGPINMSTERAHEGDSDGTARGSTGEVDGWKTFGAVGGLSLRRRPYSAYTGTVSLMNVDTRIMIIINICKMLKPNVKLVHNVVHLNAAVDHNVKEKSKQSIIYIS
jgi:hypothetical protein